MFAWMEGASLMLLVSELLSTLSCLYLLSLLVKLESDTESEILHGHAVEMPALTVAKSAQTVRGTRARVSKKPFTVVAVAPTCAATLRKKKALAQLATPPAISPTPFMTPQPSSRPSLQPPTPEAENLADLVKTLTEQVRRLELQVKEQEEQLTKQTTAPSNPIKRRLRSNGSELDFEDDRRFSFGPRNPQRVTLTVRLSL
jgi:hypothetical protein